jgi:molybdenum cofactor cytidylyltransferase
LTARPPIIGILLAAGSASRFGSDKLLHLLPDGESIAITAARHLLAAVPVCVAVVRSLEHPLAGKLREAGCRVEECARADEGMGVSLAYAVRAVGPSRDYLIALADMPFIRPSTIIAVREAMQSGAKLVAPYFRARRGHPVGIAAEFYQQLVELRGDAGARAVLEAHANELRKIPCGDIGVLRDIDTQNDLTPPLVV